MQRGDLRWPGTSAREIGDQNALLFEKKPRGDWTKRKRPGLWHDLHRAILAPHRGAIAPDVRGRPHRADLAGGGRQRLPLSEQLREPFPRQRVRPTPGARTGRSIVACRGDSGADIWLDRSCRPRVVNGLKLLP